MTQPPHDRPVAAPDLLEGAVRRERLLPAAREDAWTMLATPEGLERWLAEDVDVELRPGARGRMTVDGRERDVEIEEVVPGRRLSLTWSGDGKEPALVELTLDDAPGGTRVVVVELPVRALRVVAVPGHAPVSRRHGGGAPQARALARA
jgi:uncharacterized protein YndB with AHSA1/START domain